MREMPTLPHRLDALDVERLQDFLHGSDGGVRVSGSDSVRLHLSEPLLQDEPHCIPTKGNRARSLSKWLATTPDARLHAREAAGAIERDRLTRTERSDRIGLKSLLIAGAAALAAVLSQLPF